VGGAVRQRGPTDHGGGEQWSSRVRTEVTMTTRVWCSLRQGDNKVMEEKDYPSQRLKITIFLENTYHVYFIKRIG
jgi:hypothetical protein